MRLLSKMSRSVHLLSCILAVAMAGPAEAFTIYMKDTSGDLRPVAVSIGSIARRGSTFSPSEFSYKMTSLLFTYPDYPELGYNTSENEATARTEAKRINRVIADLHSRGLKALAHSYEIEVPKGFIPKHPDLQCSGAGLRMDGTYETWFIPGEKSGGMCMYKPGAREFIQKRFDELFRRLPDLDGVVFSMSESAVRPHNGTCATCADKTLEDKTRDMVAFLDEAITNAMHKVHPEKEPFNVARSWGVPELISRRDPEKIKLITDGFLECPRDVPVVIKVGFGDYDFYMDTAPVAIKLAKANRQPFLLDVGRRGVEPFCPGIGGKMYQRFVQDISCDALAGILAWRGKPENDSHPFKLNTLNWDTVQALFKDPKLDMQSFYTGWAHDNLGIDQTSAAVFAKILLNWEQVLVLGGSQNGCDWPLAPGSSIDGETRPGSRWTWNYNYFAKASGTYGLRANVYEATTDSIGSAQEKLSKILAEKAEAVRLAGESVRLIRTIKGRIDDDRYKSLEEMLLQAEWWTRHREAFAHAYWPWWFNPRVKPSTIEAAYSRYLKILEEPVGAPHRDMFYDEREQMETSVAARGLPISGCGIYSFDCEALKTSGGFAREPISDAERGDPRRLWLPESGNGTADLRFDGPSGEYEIGVKYRDSSSGSGSMRLDVSGHKIGEWRLEKTASPSDHWLFFRCKVSRGDSVSISASSDGASCRLYRVHFRRVRGE